MTPHVQRYSVALHGSGDCLRTAVACVLDLPLDAVPHTNAPRFSDPDLLPGNEIPGSEGWTWQDNALRAWAWLTGWKMTVETDPKYLTQPFVVACGVGPRLFPEGHERSGEPIHHAVVHARQADGSYALVQDPFWTREGLASEPRVYYEFHRLDEDRP